MTRIFAIMIGILMTGVVSAQETMVIAIGTENKLKVAAVREVVRDYPFLAEAVVTGLPIPSGVRAEPLSLEETTQGAKNRAEGAYRNGGLGVGLESGVAEIPGSGGQYVDQCVCSIFDGTHHHLGFSCGFLLPREVARLLVEEGLDLDQAMRRCGFTRNLRLGAAEGAVGVFTNGRVSRLDYSKQALVMALISVENSHYFPEFDR